MDKLKTIGWVLLSGFVSFLLVGAVLVGLTFLVQYLKAQNLLELRLFLESFLAPVLLLFIGVWFCLSGLFLSKEKPKIWGKRVIYLYLIVSVLPYVLSVFVSS
tara:strand:+ start:1480 stop:1788 length:309 start_codon:yes stop_codon:yes gene_type:complete